jgi:hypothetical protein
MTSRRQFIKLSALASSLFAFNKSKANELIINHSKKTIKPIVIMLKHGKYYRLKADL